MIKRAVCLAALGILISVGGLPAGANDTPSRPNIVFVLADDLGYGELGCYGQTKIRTPHLDRLAREGLRFTQHYSGAPVCAPSRCVLMTGKHTGHAQIRGNLQARDAAGNPTEGQTPITSDALTLAEVLKGAGYVTGAMGKWGLGPVNSSGDPNEQGFDWFFGYNCQSVAHSYFPPHLWRNRERIAINQHPIAGHAKQPDGEVRMEDWFAEKYAPDLMVEEAVQFLRTHQHDKFFLYLPFIEPHVAMQPPRRLVESYPPEWDDRPYRGQCGYLPHPRPRAGYAAMITSLDEHVGTILHALDELQLSDNTLVIFSSDNGTTHQAAGDPVFGVGGVDAAFFQSTAGLRGRKGSVYEGGIRVPMIARWPGQIPAGTKSDFPSYFADHFPTLCAVAGLEPPTGLDGINLLPTLTHQGPQSPRNPMVWVFPEYGGQVAVRIGHFKVVRRDLANRGGPAPWEIYNLATDRGETDNLASSQPQILAEAKTIFRRQMDDNATFPLSVPGLND